jgi:thiosulfate:glutathione sulfurtransferase
MKTIATQELKNLIENKNKDYILIDVREKFELSNGIIPTAKNIPPREFQNALLLSEKIFKQKYKFKKPSKSDTLILYCRTGARAEQAVEIALNLNFNAILYPESIYEQSEINLISEKRWPPHHAPKVYSSSKDFNS